MGTGLGDSQLAAAARWWRRVFLSATRWRYLVLLLLSIAAVGVVTWRLGVPNPRIQDEFSYLLAGKTFAEGRLANPPHPMWIHMEEFHVNMTPMYVSKYPPGQGAILAAGLVLIGDPYAGVALSIVLLVLATTWMLEPCVPRRYAFLGGVLTLVCYGLFSYWARSYWGGSLAAIGGALAIGGVLRGMDRPTIASGIALGIGLGLMSLTRPFEGAAMGLALAYLLVAAPRWTPHPKRLVQRRTVIAASLVVLAGFGAFWLFYNHWTTGDPFTMAYQVHSDRYGYVPLFWFQDLPERPPELHHPEIRHLFAEWSRDKFLRHQSPAGLLDVTIEKLQRHASLFLPNVAFLPLVLSPCALRDRRLRWMLGVLLFVLGASLLTVASHPHYVAMLLPIVVLCLVECLRRMAIWRPHGWPVGLVCIASWLIVVTLLQHPMTAPDLAETSNPKLFPNRRVTLFAELDSRPRQSLVIVRYHADHWVHDDWVWNEPDIDAAKVVWARDMGNEKNAELIEYFSGREVFMLLADGESGDPYKTPAKLVSYPPDELPSGY